MPEMLSTKKPQIEEKPEVKLEYNNRSYQSYVDAGFADYIPHKFRQPHDFIQVFFAAADLRKEPIERTVTAIYRVKAIDYDSPKQERKEFIYYEENWVAKNWFGVAVNPIAGHIEGRYTEVSTKPMYDERTGGHKDNAFAGTRERYYIPWSKKNVDDIIAKSAHSDKSTIRFVIKFSIEDNAGTDNPMQMATRNRFSYDVFANWPWDRIYEWHTWPFDDMYNRPKVNAGKAGPKLEFKPS